MQNLKILETYTDGSINEGVASWAFVVVSDGQEVARDSGVCEGPVNALRNIAGELKAVIEAVRYCRKNLCKALIIHDLEGSQKWVADLRGEKPWRCNNGFTQGYRDFILKNKDYIEDFQWIKGHSDNKWNDLADFLAKEAFLAWKATQIPSGQQDA